MSKQDSKALTKAETVALWHAVDWMKLCLQSARQTTPGRPELGVETERLALAKRALRKVNELRKQGL